MYIVYMHTINNKSYIGYTGKSIGDRLKQHIQLAQNGSQTKFHRAIRKYGVGSIKSKTLCECNNQEDAQKREVTFICEYDSYKSGYNMTVGGDGGDIFSCLSEDKKEKNRELKSRQTRGSKNPRFSGLSDRDIVCAAVKYFMIKGKFIRRHWMKYCKDSGLPITYSKYRFDGLGYRGLVSSLKTELSYRAIPWSEDNFILSKDERYTPEFSQKISNTLKNNAKNKKIN